MAILYEHIPGFVDRDDPPAKVEFAVSADLPSVPFVARFVKRADFDHLFRQDVVLLARMKDGVRLVLGHVGARDMAALDGLPET